jgi:hypothetical protein
MERNIPLYTCDGELLQWIDEKRADRTSRSAVESAGVPRRSLRIAGHSESLGRAPRDESLWR